MEAVDTTAAPDDTVDPPFMQPVFIYNPDSSDAAPFDGEPQRLAPTARHRPGTERALFAHDCHVLHAAFTTVAKIAEGTMLTAPTNRESVEHVIHSLLRTDPNALNVISATNRTTGNNTTIQFNVLQRVPCQAKPFDSVRALANAAYYWGTKLDIYTPTGVVPPHSLNEAAAGRSASTSAITVFKDTDHKAEIKHVLCARCRKTHFARDVWYTAAPAPTRNCAVCVCQDCFLLPVPLTCPTYGIVYKITVNNGTGDRVFLAAKKTAGTAGGEIARFVYHLKEAFVVKAATSNALSNALFDALVNADVQWGPFQIVGETTSEAQRLTLEAQHQARNDRKTEAKRAGEHLATATHCVLNHDHVFEADGWTHAGARVRVCNHCATSGLTGGAHRAHHIQRHDPHAVAAHPVPHFELKGGAAAHKLKQIIVDRHIAEAAALTRLQKTQQRPRKRSRA